MSDKRIDLTQLHGLLVKALCAHGTEAKNAEPVADALVAAEADGLPGHGLSRLPSYCAQVASGKIHGHAVPSLRQVADAVMVVDAKGGFAYPALGLAIEELLALTPKTGVALAAITRSHHCGAAGYHVEKLAKAGSGGVNVRQHTQSHCAMGWDTGGVRNESHRLCCTSQGQKTFGDRSVTE